MAAIPQGSPRGIMAAIPQGSPRGIMAAIPQGSPRGIMAAIPRGEHGSTRISHFPISNFVLADFPGP